MKYQFTVSPDGIKRTLADMFTKEVTFLTELCQNAQRAGASRIDIDYLEAEGVMMITDDGSGFSDEGWESFFTVGRSGWGDEVVREQNPFGIGCAACLYAATEICITSGQHQVHFHTDALFSGCEVDRQEVKPFSIGSVIALKLKSEINVERLLKSAETVFEAFTIPVFINGVEIDRPLSLDANRKFIDTEIGKLTLVKDELAKSRSRSSVRHLDVGFILQGFKLSDSAKSPDAWIHLQSDKHRARVPDRDCLVGDVSSVKEKAKKILSEVFRQQLTEQLEAVGLETFVVDHWFEAKTYAPELIARAPVPGYLFVQPDTIPYEDYDGYCSNTHWYDGGIPKTYSEEDLKNEHVFDTISVYGVADDGDYSFVVGNYAYLVSNQFLNVCDLPAGHWLYHKIIQTDVDDSEVQASISPRGDIKEFNVSTAGYYGQHIVLCDSFELELSGLTNMNGDPVSIGSVVCEDEAIWFAGTIYIASKCNSVESVCRQTVNMNKSEWDFELDEDYLSKVEDELWSVVRIKRGGSISDLLRDLIQEHNPELRVIADGLIGKEYRLAFSNDSEQNPVQVTIHEITAEA